MSTVAASSSASLSLRGQYESERTSTFEAIQAVRGAVKHGDLIFVPKRDDLHACVTAIQEDRQKRPAPVARQQDQSPYAPVQQMMGKPPRVPSGLNTPLSDAQPFDYQADIPDGDVEQLAGGEGTPGNNQAQNKQFKAVVRALGLSQDQAQQLHQQISKQGLGYHEIMERAQDMFGDGSD